MEAKEFGQFISEVRKSNNITQIELARKLNVTDKAVSRWERGLGFPDINTLEPLADALGVSIVELMQTKKNANAELISTEKVEEILLDTIHLSEAHSKAAKVTGTVVMVIFAVFAVWLLGVLVTDWNILMTLSRNLQITVATIISFGSALSAILFRIINIAHDINTNDIVAVIDSIDGEVMIVTVFIAITIILNVCAMLSSKRR